MDITQRILSVFQDKEKDYDPDRLLENLLKECSTYLRTYNEELITRAFRFAVKAHGKDLRASGEPYYTHPVEVAQIVAREIRVDDVSVAAALLHDVAEDTDYSLKDIQEEFGPAIANIVDGVTKISDIFHNREITKAASYRKLLLSMVNDVRVILVKFADRLHNMRTLGHLAEQKQKRLARETLDIYAPLAHRFGLGNIKWELEDLSFKYLNRTAYDQIKNELNLKRKERDRYIKKFSKPIEEKLTELHIPFEISGRAKHLYSIYNKMMSRSKTIDDIYDLFAVRLILDTPNQNDCFTVYGIVSDIYTPVPERFKNYISVPKKNGYQSLHTTVIGPEGKKVEIQIRTRSMHEVAEQGVAAHFMYKEKMFDPSVEDSQIEEWVQWVRDIFDNAGEEAPEQLMESFRLNLFQDEIYVFTPNGEVRILPKNATPIDFAFDIHSKVGYHCIGAKVNGKIVPLDTPLQSGDQVEILTSKNQKPNKDWEQIAITHKAKSHIRKYLNEEKRAKTLEGKSAWEKRLRKVKLHINDDDLEKIVNSLKYRTRNEFFYQIGTETLPIDDALRLVQSKITPGAPSRSDAAEAISPEAFAEKARQDAAVSIGSANGSILYSYARCCNPVPGDAIVGVVTIGSGVKVHRSECKNVRAMREKESLRQRLIELDWSGSEQSEFLAALRITGNDRTAMLTDITSAIVSYHNTNIRSLNIDTYNSMFEGVLVIYVRDTTHLLRIFERLRAVKGVISVERYEE